MIIKSVPASGVPSTINDTPTAPMDLPPVIPSSSPSQAPSMETKQVEQLVGALLKAGLGGKFTALLVALVLVLGVVAPIIEQGAATIFAMFSGGDERLLKIEQKLDDVIKAQEKTQEKIAASESTREAQRAKDKAVMAALIQVVEGIDAELAKTNARALTKMPAELRVIVAEFEAEQASR